MKKRIITISREFGSGGRTIGRMVAERLQVACYDKELVREVAQKTGFDENYVEQEGEDAPVRSRLAYAFSAHGVQGGLSGMSNEDYLWASQYRTIQELADKAPCVIVGRCADYVLRERDDCLNVFIHAPVADRAERIVRLYGETQDSPYKRLEDKDKKRKLYYNYYTGREWGMSQNYHLSLDSSMIGQQACIDIIVGLVD